MNRRSFVRSLSLSAAAAFAPAWRVLAVTPRAIDLSAFCGDIHRKYDLSQPSIQGDAASALHRYATDAAVCVRVPSAEAECGEGLKLPPATSLPWDHAALDRWRPWPAPRYLDLDNTECPECDGKGAIPAVECDRCQGVGMVFWAGDDFTSEDEPCPECRTTGYTGPRCRTCRGNGYGRFPGAIELWPGFYVAAKYDRLLRKHLDGLELHPRQPRCVRTNNLDHGHACLFRFHGGEGLLMPLDPRTVQDRVRTRVRP